MIDLDEEAVDKVIYHVLLPYLLSICCVYYKLQGLSGS